MVADNINHTGRAALQMNTGDEPLLASQHGRCPGSLTVLGSENENLPGFIVIGPKPVFQGSPLWGPLSFLPGSYQGTWVRDLNKPIVCLDNPASNPRPAARSTRYAHAAQRGTQSIGLIDSPRLDAHRFL